MSVDTSAFRGTASAPKQNRKYFTKNKAGQVEEISLMDDAFEAPTFGRYILRIKALGEPYEQNSGMYGPEKKIRFVFKVMGPAGPCKGRMFSMPMTIMRKNDAGEWYANVGPGSQVGKMIAAARGKPIAIGESFSYLDFLNLDFNAAVDTSEKSDDTGKVTAVYGNIVKDSYKPANLPGQTALIEPDSEPEPQPVAAGVSAAPNPFLADDDD